MESAEDLVFLDSIEAEENFLRGRTSTPTSGRRLSAASKAAILKKKNLIPPLHSPSERRISLPRASKTPTMPATNDKRKPSTRQADAPDDQAPSEATAAEKFIQEQLAALTAMIGGVKEDIGRAEVRTVAKIDEKVDDLAGKLGARMSRAEADLAKVSADLDTARKQLEAVQATATEREKALPGIVESIVASKLDSAEPKPGRRHRPLPLEHQGASAASKPANDDKYWHARKSLRLWPVVGENLKEAVQSFLQNKLLCPPGRLTADDFEARRLYSPPDLAAQSQVLVTFASVGLRDEVKSMSRNLSGTDRATGVQIEPPDHLRGHY